MTCSVKEPAFTAKSTVSPFAGCLLLAAGVLSPGAATASETRSYVVSWFHVAPYSQEGDCAGGVNPNPADLIIRNLRVLGKDETEISALMETYNGGGAGPLRELMTFRGRMNGESTDVYANPLTWPDPKSRTLTGKYAYGFDLDGKTDEQSFEDPEVNTKGVDNQLMRAVGCWTSMRAVPPGRPAWPVYIWGNLKENATAWLMSISGEDLSKDGSVTVTFDRATDAVQRDANGETMRDFSFKRSKDRRSFNVFQGHIKNGVLEIRPDTLHLQADVFLLSELRLDNTHMRLKLRKDGSLHGYVGGYQEWLPYYWSFAAGGYQLESMIGVDMSGLFYNLRRLADAHPDPKTGQNTAISATYLLEAVPAYIVEDAAVSTVPSVAINQRRAQ